MKYFTAKELFAPEILELIGESASWKLIDICIQLNLDYLRERFGEQIFINGGEFNYSGVRPIDCKIGAKFSSHKPIYIDKIAFDLKAKNIKKLWDLITKNHYDFNICRVENFEKTRNWIHAEFSINPVSELIIFNP